MPRVDANDGKIESTRHGRKLFRSLSGRNSVSLFLQTSTAPTASGKSIGDTQLEKHALCIIHECIFVSCDARVFFRDKYLLNGMKCLCHFPGAFTCRQSLPFLLCQVDIDEHVLCSGFFNVILRISNGLDMRHFAGSCSL